MKKTFQIAQRLEQTDWYEVEAETAEEAMRIYENNLGELHSTGSTSGWVGKEGEECIVIPQPVTLKAKTRGDDAT
jgi:hypothetical protein